VQPVFSQSSTRLESSVEGRSCDAEACCNLRHRNIGRFEQSADGFNLFGGELRWTAPGSTAGASCFETRDGSFADQVALELGERGEDMENEPPGRRAGFNLLGQGFEVDLTLFELCDEADEVG
jgi:hypothetical protein